METFRHRETKNFPMVIQFSSDIGGYETRYCAPKTELLTTPLLSPGSEDNQTAHKAQYRILYTTKTLDTAKVVIIFAKILIELPLDGQYMNF